MLIKPFSVITQREETKVNSSKNTRPTHRPTDMPFSQIRQNSDLQLRHSKSKQAQAATDQVSSRKLVSQKLKEHSNPMKNFLSKTQANFNSAFHPRNSSLDLENQTNQSTKQNTQIQNSFSEINQSTLNQTNKS